MRYGNKRLVRDKDTIVNHQRKRYNYALLNYNLYKDLCCKNQKFYYCSQAFPKNYHKKLCLNKNPTC